MGFLRFLLVVANAVLFAWLAVASIRYRAREQSDRVKTLWLIVTLLSTVFVVGSVQRVLVQAAMLGWLPESMIEFAASNWQIVQSVVVAVFTVVAFVAIRSLAESLALSENVAQSILIRVDHVEVAQLDLTPRETEVLEAIGAGLISDAELCEALHISRSTVQTHVKRLLRKTNLESRNDLVAVAHLVARRGQQADPA